MWPQSQRTSRESFMRIASLHVLVRHRRVETCITRVVRLAALCFVLSAVMRNPLVLAQISHPPGNARLSTGQGGGPAKARAFDVVSIRATKPGNSTVRELPDGYIITKQPLLIAILLAYLPPRWFAGSWGLDRIVGAPPWLRHDLYDLQGKVAPEDIAEWQQQGSTQALRQAMLRTALEERCHLTTHRTFVVNAIFGLVLRRPNAKLKESQPGEVIPSTAVHLITGGRMIPIMNPSHPQVTFYGISMDEFAAYLSQSSSRPVLNKSGLAGRYDFTLSKIELQESSDSDPEAASIWNVEEVGFKLLPMKAMLETVVIDHVTKPVEN